MKKLWKLYNRLLIFMVILLTFTGCSFIETSTPMHPSLSSLIFSTYIGGSGGELIRAMEQDSQKNIYIGGETSSSDFPMRNAYQDTFHPHGADAFLAKFSPDGQLLWSTYLGGDHEFNHSPEMNKMYPGNGPGGLSAEVITCIQVTEDAVYAGGYTNAESVPEFRYSTPHDYWFLNSFIAVFTPDGQLVRMLEFPYIEDNGYLILQDFQWVGDNEIVMSGIQRLWNKEECGRYVFCIASLHVEEDNRVTLNWKQTITTPGSSRGKYWEEVGSISLCCYKDSIYTACTSRADRGNIPYGYVSCYTKKGTPLWTQYIEATKKKTQSSIETGNGSTSWTAVFTMAVNEEGIYVGGEIKNDGFLPKAKKPNQKTNPEDALNTQSFIAHLSHQGTILQTRAFGGNDQEAIYDMTMNDEGLLFVTGSTSSTDFPLVNPLQDQIMEKETYERSFLLAPCSQQLYQLDMENNTLLALNPLDGTTLAMQPLPITEEACYFSFLPSDQLLLLAVKYASSYQFFYIPNKIIRNPE